MYEQYGYSEGSVPCEVGIVPYYIFGFIEKYRQNNSIRLNFHITGHIAIDNFCTKINFLKLIKK